MVTTLITSLKVTVIPITSSALKYPSLLVAVTLVTVGTIPSITKALFAPSELVAPGLAKVKVASLPTPSFMVPLLSAKELVAT